MDKLAGRKGFELILEGWRDFMNEGDAMSNVQRAIESGDAAAADQALTAMRLLNFRKVLQAGHSELTMELPRDAEILQAGDEWADVLAQAMNKALDKLRWEISPNSGKLENAPRRDVEAWHSAWRQIGFTEMPDALSSEEIYSISEAGPDGDTISQLQNAIDPLY